MAKYLIVLILSLFCTTAYADEVRMLETWFPQEKTITDFKVVELYGKPHLIASIDSQEMNDHNFWVHDIEAETSRQWVWNTAYGPRTIDLMSNDEILSCGTDTWPARLICLDINEDTPEEEHSYDLQQFASLHYQHGMNLAISRSLGVYDYKIQFAVFKDENFSRPFLRELMIDTLAHNAQGFDCGGSFIVGRTVYCVNGYLGVGQPDLLVVDLSKRGHESYQFYNLPLLESQVGNIIIHNGFAYIATYGTNYGVHVYNMHNSTPNNWTLEQIFKGPNQQAVSWIAIDFANNDLYYLGHTRVGYAKIQPDGTLEHVSTWLLSPRRTPGVNAKILYHDNQVYFTSAPEGQVYARCIMALKIR